MAKRPKTLLLLNNSSLYGTQGKKHLHAIFNEDSSYSITGHHIQDEIEAHKLELGLSPDLFSNCLPPMLKCLTPISITHTVGRSLLTETLVTDYLCTPSARNMARAREVFYILRA